MFHAESSVRSRAGDVVPVTGRQQLNAVFVSSTVVGLSSSPGAIICATSTIPNKLPFLVQVIETEVDGEHVPVPANKFNYPPVLFWGLDRNQLCTQISARSMQSIPVVRLR
jgi:hypothetical protein